MAAGISLMDFFLEIGIKADTLKLKDLVSTIGELNLKSVFTAVGLGAMYDGIEKIMTIGVSTTMTMEKFNAVTGISMKEAEQFSKVAVKYGASAEEALSSLAALQQSVLSLAMAGNQEPFRLLGLKPTLDDLKDPLKKGGLFDQLVDKMKDPRWFDAMKARELSQLGVNDSLMLMLKTVDNLHAEMDKMPFTSDEDRKKLMEYNESWQQLAETFKTIETIIAGRFANTMKGISDVILGTSGNVNTLEHNINTLIDRLEIGLGVLSAVLVGAGLLTKNAKMISMGATLGAGVATSAVLSHGSDWMNDFNHFRKDPSIWQSDMQKNVTNHVNVTVNAHTNANPKEISAQIAEEISTLLLVTSQEKHYGIK